MEAQHLAEHVLNMALWSTADSSGRNGEDNEIAFLLEEMLGGRVISRPVWEEGWTTEKLFDGKRAVDLARTPGGLKTITDAYEADSAIQAELGGGLSGGRNKAAS
jgi:hypothetical protein